MDADYARREEVEPRVLHAVTVPATSLDAEFANDRLDLVKIESKAPRGSWWPA